MSSITCGDLTLTAEDGCLSAALAGIPLTEAPLPLMEVWLEGQGTWAGPAMTWTEKHDRADGWELLSLTGRGGIMQARVDLLAGAAFPLCLHHAEHTLLSLDGRRRRAGGPGICL